MTSPIHLPPLAITLSSLGRHTSSRHARKGQARARAVRKGLQATQAQEALPPACCLIDWNRWSQQTAAVGV